MAAFIAKQVVGKQLESVKGALGDKEEKDEKDKKGDGGEDEDEEAIAEARREEEEKRKEKHRRMEEEREKMRQEIRDKYGIKKKESPTEDPSLDGRLGRRTKGQQDETMATTTTSSSSSSSSCSATGSSPENDAGVLPINLENLTTKVKELPEKMMSTVTDASDKCRLQ